VAQGSTAIVPDGFSSVQAAVDTYADTVLIRAGVYPESVLVLPQFKPIVLMADPAAPERPTLQGLKLWANRDHDGNIKVVGLRIATPGVIWSSSTGAHYDFEACRFEAGLGNGGVSVDHDYAGSTSLIRCNIHGGIQLTVTDLTMDSDTLEAGGASFLGEYVSVQNSWFRGPAGLVITNMSPINYVVSGNVFEDCAVGVRVYDDYYGGFVRIEDNTLSRSQNWGIQVDNVESVDILRNDVRDGGGGIYANVHGAGFRVIGNSVIGAAGAGISLTGDVYGGYVIEVRSNGVLRCRGSGIVFNGNSDPTYFISGNTSAINEGSGFAMAISASYEAGPFSVSNNIAYGNAGAGFSLTGPSLPTLGCNDWFMNTTGATSGTAAGSTDLYVDPLFCDIANDDARLRSDSPLIGSACGQIGADSVGCDPTTPVLVALLAAETSDRGVGIHWRLGGDEDPASVWIERSSAEPGPWQAIVCERVNAGGFTIDWDRGAEPGQRYWYRLAWTTRDGQASRSSPIEVLAAPSVAAFELRRVGPNPTAGPVAIEYALPRSAAIEITIHDLLGREVARIENGIRSPGVHVAHWAGEARGGRAGPGVYFVRMSWPEGQEARRILLRR
jgi:hypothetical protein